MPAINEEATTVVQTTGSPDSNTHGNANYGLDAGWWTVANMAAVAIPTNLLILGVQSPVKTALIGLTQHGSFLPANRPAGLYSLVSFLYKGTQAAAAGSVARTAVVTTVKNNSKSVESAVVTEGPAVENLLNESENTLKNTSSEKMTTSGLSRKAGFLMTGAALEVAATQISDTLSQLRKMPGFLPANFKWSTSPLQLATAGIVPRYLASIGSFYAMTFVEESIANRLPEGRLKHTVAGAASGAFAALSTYPLAALKDYMLVNSTISKDGKLVLKGLNDSLLDLGFAYLANPREAIKAVAINAGKRLPMSMGLTATIFSIVSGMSSALGNEPLNRFVSKKEQPSGAALVAGDGVSTAFVPPTAANPAKVVVPKRPVLATTVATYTGMNGYPLMAVTSKKHQPPALVLSVPTTAAVSTASTAAAVEYNGEDEIVPASPKVNLGANRFGLFGANSAIKGEDKLKKSPSNPAAEGTKGPKSGS